VDGSRPPSPAVRATNILHVDMDAFFASVEALDDPSLAGIPLVVGGDGERGVVASCSYEARAYGVRSAMPSTEARRRCPVATFVPARHGRYGEVSEELHRIFHDVTPLVEGIALDEAFLDVGGAVRLLGPPAGIAAAIRARVADELGLTCSVGVARCKLFAKLASREAKPRADRRGITEGRGVVVIDPEQEISFLHPLPVRALWGVGPRTAERLARYGLSTVGDVAAVGEQSLCRLLGKALGTQLFQLAWGRDTRPVEPSRPLKSVGHEETFSVDVHEHGELRRHAVRMADSVAGRLRRAGVSGRTVVVKVRFADFTTITRSRTLALPTTSGSVIATTAIELLARLEVSPGVRLLGVSATGLGPAEEAAVEQLSFEDVRSASGTERAARRDVDEAVDAVRRKFGATSVGPASLGPSSPEDGPGRRRRSGPPGVASAG
jgi:DNA polymerase-4